MAVGPCTVTPPTGGAAHALRGAQNKEPDHRNLSRWPATSVHVTKAFIGCWQHARHGLVWGPDDGAADRVPCPRYFIKAKGNLAGRRCEVALRCSHPATRRGTHVTDAGHGQMNPCWSTYCAGAKVRPSPLTGGWPKRTDHTNASLQRGAQPMSRNPISSFFLSLLYYSEPKPKTEPKSPKPNTRRVASVE